MIKKIAKPNRQKHCSERGGLLKQSISISLPGHLDKPDLRLRINLINFSSSTIRRRILDIIIKRNRAK